ncbi:MAG: efflux RND transporter periplasmic adaptor subunit [Sulfuritalea sp.]|nr:efflux RND transporter periplasmic adaptor subunit [Sulfuritalea sp.]
MNKIAIAVLIVAVGGLGYWFGGQQGQKVGGGEMASGAPEGRKILYYRNPMGLPDTSPVPKKDSMGMDYIPVYEGEEQDAGGAVKISTARVQKLGVRTEAATVRELVRPIRSVGRIEVDERRVVAVAPKFEGWIERLHVNATGQAVGRGQPLFEVYSPELVSAQREYQVAARGVTALAGAGPEAQAGMRRVAESALARLANWDISAEQIERLTSGGEPQRTLTFRSPAAGVILERKALQGMRFMPGETLYEIGDLSNVWVIVDVFERDIAAVKVGQAVAVRIDAWPDRTLAGKVSYLYPTLNVETRTTPVRIELANPKGELRPGMYAQAEVNVGAGGTALAIPLSAVIEGGVTQRVLVQVEAGRFEPREVKLGLRGDDYVEVKAGVKEGEQVVVAANFLIDSESNLKAALAAMKRKPTVSHHAVGTLDSIEASGAVMVTHEPVASLNWPQMTMEFILANPALIDKLQPGARIHFEFGERKPGEWVITRIEAH